MRCRDSMRFVVALLVLLPAMTTVGVTTAIAVVPPALVVVQSASLVAGGAGVQLRFTLDCDQEAEGGYSVGVEQNGAHGASSALLPACTGEPNGGILTAAAYDMPFQLGPANLKIRWFGCLDDACPHEYIDVTIAIQIGLLPAPVDLSPFVVTASRGAAVGSIRLQFSFTCVRDAFTYVEGRVSEPIGSRIPYGTFNAVSATCTGEPQVIVVDVGGTFSRHGPAVVSYDTAVVISGAGKYELNAPGSTAIVQFPPQAPETTVPGANMLANGSFENGAASLAPWIFRHDVAAAVVTDGIDTAEGAIAAKVTIAATSKSTWLVQLRQEGVHLQAGTSYTVSFWARSSTTRTINARLQSPVAPYSTFIAKDFTATPVWERYSFVYTSPSEVENAFVGFNLAQATGDVWLDQVAVYESNLVHNGGFESGTTRSPWTWRNDIDATFGRDSTVHFDGLASGRITVPTAGSTSWQAQARAPIAAVLGGRQYLVSFAIRASRSRAANVRLQSGDEPYPTAAANNFDVGTTWKQVSFVWAPSIDITNAFLGFNLSQDTGTVWIDDVALIELPTDPI